MAFTGSAERINLGAVHFPLKDYVTKEGILHGRTAGRRARQELEGILDSGAIGPDDVIALDFKKVVAIDVPFADELLGRLLSGRIAGYYDNHPILAVNAGEQVKESLDATLRRRGLFLLGATEPHGADLLGGDELLELTLRAAAAAGRFNATELAGELGITPQAMNNRLKTLLQSGALRRTRTLRAGGGKEFEYEVPGTSSGSGRSSRTRKDRA